MVGPAFSAAATKQYKHVFNDKAREVSLSHPEQRLNSAIRPKLTISQPQLTSKWVDQLKKDSSVLIDVSHAVSWCTTDIIGLGRLIADIVRCRARSNSLLLFSQLASTILSIPWPEVNRDSLHPSTLSLGAGMIPCLASHSEVLQRVSQPCSR